MAHDRCLAENAEVEPRRPGYAVRWTVIAATALGATALPALAGPGTASTPPLPAERLSLVVIGPDDVAIGDSVHLAVDGGTPGATYAWDLDGDGVFEHDTGTDAFVDFGFDDGGKRTVAVRVTSGASTSVGTRQVTVTRPDVARLVMSPPNPRPGQKVELRVVSRSDRGGFAAYAWDVEGVKATRTTATYRNPSSGGVKQLIDLAGSGLDVTADPKLVVEMPSGKKNDDRTISFEVTAISAAGALTTLKRTVTLDLAPDPEQDPYLGHGTIDCDNPPPGVPKWPCAQVGTSGDLLAGVPSVFFDGTPTVEACYPVKDIETANHGTVVTELKNLGYPPPTVIANPGIEVGIPGRTTTRAEPEEECEAVGGLTQLWEWGDGTTTKANGLDAADGYVWTHVYDEPGTYTVHLTSKVPYLTKGGGPTGLRLRRFTARASWEVEIRGADCDGLSLHGIPLRAVSLYKPDGCFVPQGALDGTGTVYRVQQGYDLSIGGQVLKATKTPPLVNLETGTISVGTGTMSGRWQGTARKLVPPTSTFVVPPPAYDPQLGVAASALPAFEYPDPNALDTKFGGLPTPSAQAFVSPERPAMMKVYVQPPRPLQGATPPVLVFGKPSYAARAADDETDFELDLSDVDLGGFHITDGRIAHRKVGGWFGGVTLDVSGLGTLAAPYKPPGDTSGDCETITGPSGLSLGFDGSFDFAGATLVPASPIAIGPLGLDCIAIQGKGEPFTMIGKAGLSAPYNGPIKLDACLGFSILDAGQATSACGASLTAPDDLVWMVGTGSASLYDVLPLASAYVDTRLGPNYKSIGFGGHFGYEVASFSISADVGGTIVVDPAFAFDLIVTAHLCQENPIKDLCLDVQGGVSSKGFGACAWFGGFVYYWSSGPRVFVASCDLKARIGVGKQIAYSRRSTVATVPVPAGQERVAFAVESATGVPPDLEITRPDGTHFAALSAPAEMPDGTTVVKYPTESTTTVTVPAPQAGSWTIRSLVQGRTAPDITVELYTPDVVPEVEADVVGSGQRRTLRYDAQLGEDDELVLVEDGTFGTRVLGTRDADGTGNLAIRAGGVAEKRTVRAIVLRNGVPFREIDLDTYRAPAPLALAMPSGVTVTPQGSSATASWQPVPGATAYDVVARLACAASPTSPVARSGWSRAEGSGSRAAPAPRS